MKSMFTKKINIKNVKDVILFGEGWDKPNKVNTFNDNNYNMVSDDGLFKNIKLKRDKQ